MKRVALLTLLSAFAAFTSFAANFTTTVQCLPQPGNIAVGGSSISVTCASLISVVAGATLVSASLDTIGDYDGGPNGTTSGTQVNVVVNGITGFANTSLTSVVTGGRFRVAQTNPSTTNTTLTASQAQSLTVNATAISGSATTASNYTEIVYTYSVGTTPEPTSLTLLGSGFLGLLFAARKRLVRK